MTKSVLLLKQFPPVFSSLRYYFGSYIGKVFKITSKAIKVLMAVWLALCGGQPPSMATISPAIQVLQISCFYVQE
jgi:hypothetical protein